MPIAVLSANQSEFLALEHDRARIFHALSSLRKELIDMAYDLEKCPYLDAADLACGLARRLETLIAENDVKQRGPCLESIG